MKATYDVLAEVLQVQGRRGNHTDDNDGSHEWQLDGWFDLDEIAAAIDANFQAAIPSEEALARAICAAEPRAPHPDARILIGMRESAAWEGRLPQARAVLALLRGDVP